jgi:high-affinity nickel-transport protein
LLILTFVLGMKHGFDADHLATIDGLTRYNARSQSEAGALCAAPCSRSATAPWSWPLHWRFSACRAVGGARMVRTLGAVISIGFLVALGSLNLAAVLRAEPHEMVAAGRPQGAPGSVTLAQVSNPGWWRWSARCLRCPSTRMSAGRAFSR